MEKLKTIDYKGYFFHGMSGYLGIGRENDKRRIALGLKRLESVLKYGLLSREKLLEIYGTEECNDVEYPYFGDNLNDNGHKHISICTSTGEAGCSFPCFVNGGIAISMALENTVLGLPHRKSYEFCMGGEVQIEDQIPVEMFKGIALSSWFDGSKYEDETVSRINKIQERCGTDLSLFEIS